SMKELGLSLLATPEGRQLRAQLSSSGGLGAEFDIATSLLTTDTTLDGNGRKRAAKTASGHPPPLPAHEVDEQRGTGTSILGSRDRTPPGREVSPDLGTRRSLLPLVFGGVTVALVGTFAAVWVFVLQPAARAGQPKAA